MNALLDLIAMDADNNTYSVSTHFYTILAANNWQECKHFFNSTDVDEQWETRSSIPINADTLIIPVHTGNTLANQHWSVLLRTRSQPKGRYELFYFDSLNDPSRAAAVCSLLKSTPL